MNIEHLPREPGVYLFKDKNDEIVYIGKANSLRSRVHSYFNGKNQSIKTQHLVKRIHKIDHIVVHNEVEALLLENRLIKKHRPRYNILLKDAKTYAYIKITDERLPRVISTRRVTKKGTYFGPYTDAAARATLVKLANSIFKLRTSKSICRKPCLNVHLNLCSGPCVNMVSQEQYLEQVEQAKSFIKGDRRHVLNLLGKSMRDASSAQNYELAKQLRDQLQAVKDLDQKQRVDRIRSFDQTVISYVPDGQKAIISIIHIKRGVISGRDELRFDESEDLLREFITQYYSTRTIPREILLNKPCWRTEKEHSALEEYLAKHRAASVSLVCPQRGDKLALVKLAEKNATRTSNALIELQRVLKLKDPPKVIECFDISNLGREHIVAGMVRCIDGNPDTNGYRRFAMREAVGKQNDFASMFEAVYRRYKRLKLEKKEFPDLVLIDGGRGQLKAARQALQKARVDLHVVALAKKREELFIEDRPRPLQLGITAPAILLLRGIRDRVHKYAIAYNKQKRKEILNK